MPVKYTHQPLAAESHTSGALVEYHYVPTFLLPVSSKDFHAPMYAIVIAAYWTSVHSSIGNPIE